MFETCNERVELLKAGYTAKKMEELYVKYNEFKIVYRVLFVSVETDSGFRKQGGMTA